MSAVREILARFGVSFDTHELKKGHDKINETVESLKHLGHAVAGVFALHTIEHFVEETVGAASELKRASRVLGVSAGEMQEWQHAANMSGVAAESLTTALRFLGRNAYEAMQGGAVAQEFEHLGVNVKDAEGHVRPLTEMVGELADKFNEISDPAEKLNLAMKLFGRGGAEILPLLNKGSEGIEEFRHQIEELGGGFNDEFLKLSTKFSQHEKQLGILKRSISAQLVGLAIPGLLKFGHYVEAAGKWLLEANKHGELLRATVAGFALMALSRLPQIVATLKHMNWQILIAVAKFALLYLALDDLITWFRGGDSMIGRFFGAFAPGVNEAAQALGDFFAFSVGGWGQFGQAAKLALMSVGAGVEIMGLEISNDFRSTIAKMIDTWAELLQALHLPAWLQSQLGGDSANMGRDNEERVRAENAKRTQDKGLEVASVLEGNTDFQAFKAAAQARRSAGEATATVSTPVQEHNTSVKHEDHSTHNVTVNVPATTPTNIAHKTAAAVSRAERGTNRMALGSLEHVTEG